MKRFARFHQNFIKIEAVDWMMVLVRLTLLLVSINGAHLHFLVDQAVLTWKHFSKEERAWYRLLPACVNKYPGSFLLQRDISHASLSKIMTVISNWNPTEVTLSSLSLLPRWNRLKIGRRVNVKSLLPGNLCPAGHRRPPIESNTVHTPNYKWRAIAY